jgi:Ca2+-binding RTX toxin-like protein
MIGATVYGEVVSIENVVGGQLHDRITGTGSANAIDGQDGDDTINDGNGADTVAGGGGNDTFKVGDSIVIGDSWDGGLGFDIWDVSLYSYVPGVEIDLGAGEWRYSGFSEVILNVEGVRGSQGGETLLGSTVANLLDGQSGDDTIRGLAGADTILGGFGNDLLQGGADGDSMDGGDGIDTLDYSGGPAVTVSLATAGFQNTVGSGFDKIVGVENLIGTAGADILGGDGEANEITGGAQSDTITGSGGADTLDGSQGGDSITGGAADDVILGGFGPDTMVGGPGIDTLNYSFLAGETFLDISIAIAQNTHSGGNDTIIGFENIYTGAGDDRLFGSGQVNVILSGEGADTVKAADGADIIYTGGGDDRVNGGGAADYIYCGAGRDYMRGALGGDTFDFDSNTESAVGVALCDLIRDFRTAQGDKIDLSGVIAGTFTYLGSLGFTGTTAEVRVIDVAQGQLVQIDSDVDGLSDMEILVANSGLAGGAADFIL